VTTRASTPVHILGIRHHGPGSARSVVEALEQLHPDMILLEGPPDAQEVLGLAADKEMKPPVALLVYRPENPRHASYFPFAEFSPEWQTIRYGLQEKTPIRFFDLPMGIRFAMDEEREAKEAPRGVEPSEGPPVSAPHPPAIPEWRLDPIGFLAKAAGYDDSERWWEQHIEQRREAGNVFEAIVELMTSLREDEASNPTPPDETDRDDLREAWMRQAIRGASKEGFGKIAVVCGAWHVPALLLNGHGAMSASEDANRLKGLKKAKIVATWVPWTNSRLTFRSGYGAGIMSPGYYEHLWHLRSHDHVSSSWMAKMARLLRDEDLDASTASVIEATRLADALASLRGRTVPGLGELNEAARSVFCFGDDTPLVLVHERLVVGHRLGEVPESTPLVPLDMDLKAEQKRLRLKPEADEKSLDLDLRKEVDLDRSHLLHRLSLLGVPWGKLGETRGKGTFHEVWRLRWEPEFAIALIEAAPWGHKIVAAAAAKCENVAAKTSSLPELSGLVQSALLANLPETVGRLMVRVENLAAVGSDVLHLMQALPPLASVLRYGSVRKTDSSSVAHVVDSLVVRICIGLPGACSSLNDEAAGELYSLVNSTHETIGMLQNEKHRAAWTDLLGQLADQQGLHGLIAGRASRLLTEQNAWSPEESARHLEFALSQGAEPELAASWIEGFLRGSGLLLVHHATLFGLIDAWVSSLDDERFQRILPLLRRTFSTFSMPERRNLGEMAKRLVSSGTMAGAVSPVSGDTSVDTARANRVIPVLSLLLGRPNPPS
jgi:hypothetical protein